MTVDTLAAYGLTEMSDDEIVNFLHNQRVGILGLPTGTTPYLLPLSFGFEEPFLYFSFFVGDDSRKVTLSQQTDAASFLVYSVDSAFSWESVLLEGSLNRLPREEWKGRQDALTSAWHIDLFDRAETEGELQIFAFEIQRRSGLKAVGLPPGMDRTTRPESDPESQ
jgi:nitroimidazol reductase NimA-like FMN-containing flavoprotein (pyridoxamine 5'-phosphate oxidase superfamily)